MPKATESKPPSFVACAREGMKHVWLTTRLWELSKALPVFEYDVTGFNSFDEDVWFGNQHKPTINKVLEHCRKIENADLQYPIILSENGIVFDGIHRICKAHLMGRNTIPAVQFTKDPEPDQIVPLSEKVTLPS